jgi:hypothetical protein
MGKRKLVFDSIPEFLAEYPMTPDECFKKDAEENGEPIFDHLHRNE